MSPLSIAPAPRPPVTRRGLIAALALAACAPAAFAFDSGSTGADGALAPTVNTVIELPPSGVLNYTSINIPQGVTVKFKRNTLNTPVQLLVAGDVTLAGSIDIRGEDARHSGTYGDGNLADDGIPGVGGPGGFDGGRGGQADQAQQPAVIRGGTGLGPGGGLGGIEGADGCSGRGYHKFVGLGAGHATAGSAVADMRWRCGSNADLSFLAKPYGSNLLQPLIGGSGGGGGRGGANYPGSGGGGGGGALLIAASGTIQLAASSSIDATGGDAGGVGGINAGGEGGGGSGGAVRLVASRIAGNGKLFAAGGCINQNNNRRQTCLYLPSFSGYGGAAGRIRLEADNITFSGTSDPAYTADKPGPLFLANVPALRIDTVGGKQVPANPTGQADLSFPADLANPVTVTFKTINVPTGNTVLLRVLPAYGQPIEALSPAIVGSAAEGSASVQVTLPPGPSVLQATTTYTVVVAVGEALSRFANNERVDKVQLMATLGGSGEAQARLITVSGKSFTVPASVLQQAGLPG
ncbi:hypothetical protein JI739_07390 [Ramlibacter sp. AW1]|uniref:SbsA Ig-like domain-containing protein n=1 Tax=Ramlibacter aurantiacus TaxID=2801330 RepID=A0A936ZMS8_9BURK|nr:hypothetical protein [Ramlibacter aurantiacus]MBL0420168.1 hypothetical protein [Ramlibacter aurantiacus]